MFDHGHIDEIYRDSVERAGWAKGGLTRELREHFIELVTASFESEGHMMSRELDDLIRLAFRAGFQAGYRAADSAGEE